VLTTEQPEACRARLAAGITHAGPSQPAPVKRSRRDKGKAPQSDNGPPVQEVHASSLVLSGNSDFFKAAVTWGRSTGPAGSKKRQRDEPHVFIMSLASEDLFPTAKGMLRFMYTQRLEEGLDRAELMQLVKLADEYGVAHLRCACLQQLSCAPLDQWSVSEVQLLHEVLDIICSDSLAAGELASAASTILTSLAARFIKLEEAWRNEEQREVFCGLPYAVVLRIVSSDDLVIASEDTVVVAAVSWLRGCRGKGASLEERREVLRQVRLLLLSPWFVSWLVANVPESHELLLPADVAKLVRHMALPAAARGAYQADDPLLQRWVQRRQGAVPAMTMDLEASMSKQALLDQVRNCRKDNIATEVCSDFVFFAGFYWTLAIVIQSAIDIGDPEAVVVWCGAFASLEVGSEVIGQRQDDMLHPPVQYLLTVGNLHKKSLITAPSGTPFGEGTGTILASLGPEDDPAAALKLAIKGGSLTVHARLVQ
jgi:hypothetical protein